MSKCDLEKCQLTDDVAEIKDEQQKLHDTTLRMVLSQEALVGKIDDYIENGKADHAELFKRTRWGVTWKALGLTTASLIATLATILKIAGVY